MKKSLAVLIVLVLGLVCPSWTAAQGTVRLAALFNLTGGMASIDVPGLHGARLKVDQVNADGGVLGRKLELIPHDTRTEETIVAAAARRAVEEGAVAGLGYGDTNYVMAAGPVFQSAGVPFVTSGATHPDLPKWIGDNLFMAAFGDDDQSFAVADFAFHQLKIRRLAVWTDSSLDFTRTLSRFFAKRFRQLGGEIGLEDYFKAGDRDFSLAAGRLKAEGDKIQAVFVAAGPDEAGPSVRDIRKTLPGLPVLSGDGFDTELLRSVPGPALADKVFFATHAFRQDPRPEVRTFIQAYQTAFGRPPESAFAALGYDAAGLIVEGLKKAGTADKSALRQALAGIRSFSGVTGTIAYTRESRVPVKPVAIVGLDKGQHKLVWTWQAR